MNNDILDIEQPILISDVLPFIENQSILHILSETKGWIMQNEANIIRYDSAFTNDYPQTGWGLMATERGHKNFYDTNLNVIAKIISSLICQKLQIKKIRGIERIHWNYYSKGQEGVGHVDRDEDRYISILYNPLTTDGGTEIKKVFYPDIAGQAKVFKSNWLHRGVTTKKDKSRVSLNIILEL
jgi:hypothetical protein|tara:strand:- start:323 stop:871 length:549 start_codon:yes stop_codon:yes gene_type:complete